MFAALCGLVTFLFLLFRNTWVYRNRTRILREDARNWRPGDSKYFPRYDSLPSYHLMIAKFWIWDMNKFLEQK